MFYPPVDSTTLTDESSTSLPAYIIAVIIVLVCVVLILIIMNFATVAVMKCIFLNKEGRETASFKNVEINTANQKESFM